MDSSAPAEQHRGPVSQTHNCADADDGFKHLQAHIATSAFDSDQHADAPKCHPNTRIAVLDEIMAWITLAVTRIQWILWLNGAAGAGKSAIARSVVDLCLKQKIPIAQFFFFRTDSSRNHIKPVVATIAYQIMQQLPELKAIIIPRMQDDPLIFNKSLHTQFEYLVFDPLRELEHDSLSQAVLVLLFDGMDECIDKGDQVNLIRTISKFMVSDSFRVIAYFGSRAEPQLSSAFRSPTISNSLLQLPLDDHYLPDADICIYLNDTFAEIKLTHTLSHHINDNWPAPGDVDMLVEKSSGQFVYASVAMNFISTADLHPGQQLEIVRGLRPVGRLTPFAQLDALYLHIFSQVLDIDRVAHVLAWQLFGRPGPHSPFGRLAVWSTFLDVHADDIHTAFAGLTSVIKVKSGEASITLEFLHASLPDFLIDMSRSKQYHLDRTAWSTHWSIILFCWIERSAPPDTSQSASTIKSESVDVGLSLCQFLAQSEMLPKLRQYAVEFKPPWMQTEHSDLVRRYLSVFKQLDLGDGPSGEVYQKLLKYMAQRALKNNSYNVLMLDDIKNVFTGGLSRSDAMEQTWATREAEMQQTYQEQQAAALHHALQVERAAKDREWGAREAEIRRADRDVMEHELAAREAAFRQERSEWAAREAAIRQEERSTMDREWAVREAAIRQEERDTIEREAAAAREAQAQLDGTSVTQRKAKIWDRLKR